ncbi:uncharacterized protein LOC122318768 isoform X1 [Carya illinoinensis]|uniref:uncharacterized protein LOC122318768 isoform X1 n=1 Tax=Carya illinoinensis TaxID=32201 RepID=UPI001C71AB9A|nr:uncharacterized protein LOC122318768 isoform X1 [Carya illinoinensis]
MGASESIHSSSQRPADEITRVSEVSEVADPILERLKSLRLTTPILTSAPTESSLTDILVRKPSSSSAPATVDPKVLMELFSIYRDWQEKKIQMISKNQEEIENKIEVADALAVKLLQRFNYSVSEMKTTSQHLSGVLHQDRSTETIFADSAAFYYCLWTCIDFLQWKMHSVHALQVEIGELKGRLTEVLSNCDALCKRIASEGPESLRSSVKPFAIATDPEIISPSSTSPGDLNKIQSPTKPS